MSFFTAFHIQSHLREIIKLMWSLILVPVHEHRACMHANISVVRRFSEQPSMCRSRVQHRCDRADHQKRGLSECFAPRSVLHPIMLDHVTGFRQQFPVCPLHQSIGQSSVRRGRRRLDTFSNQPFLHCEEFRPNIGMKPLYLTSGISLNPQDEILIVISDFRSGPRQLYGHILVRAGDHQ